MSEAGFVTPPFDDLAACVNDVTRPAAARTRAIFYLRTIGTEEAAEVLRQALLNKDFSPLYRHELGYVLGQMNFASSVPALRSVLLDTSDEVIVRHECGEALGAIGSLDAQEALKQGSMDEHIEIRETCELALEQLAWKNGGATEDDSKLDENPYLSHDPAPAEVKTKTIEELRAQLLDTSLSLFVRYRAMFSLRNRGTKEAIKALVDGFQDSSALFRHEIAYVLGQVQSPYASSGLSKVLVNGGEHGMVRHEAAEALGAIGRDKEVELLERFLSDSEGLVRESCEVALDAADYWSTATATTTETTTTTGDAVPTTGESTA